VAGAHLQLLVHGPPATGFRIFPHDCWEPAMPAISGAPHDLRVLRDVRGFFLVYIGFRWQRGSAVNADGIYLHFVPDSQRRKGPDT
jgi:hypothetical protein